MTAGRYQAVDARTRGEAAPFWHRPRHSSVVFRPVSVPAPATSFSAKFSGEPNRVRALMLLDFVCGLLSLIALMATIPWNGTAFNIDNELRWPMWHEHVVCYNHTFDTSRLDRASVDIASTASVRRVFENATAAGMQFAYNATDALAQQYCHKDPASYALPRIRRTWNDTRYECSVLARKADGFDLWLALRIVFAISLVFQWGRAGVFHWVLQSEHAWVFQCGRTGAAVIEDIQLYNPYKPDFWRWWEYALTSSIQTAIIALSFFIGSRSEVLCLAGLQGALCLLGFAIEKRIDKLYKWRIKKGSENASKPENASKSNFKIAKLLILFTAAWSFFAIIWSILLTRFNRQRDASTDCSMGIPMPEAVTFIVWGEFTLFLSFGLAQTWHVFMALYQTAYYEDEELMQRRISQWYWVAVCYSVLSIVAKSILEIGLLWLSQASADMI